MPPVNSAIDLSDVRQLGELAGVPLYEVVKRHISENIVLGKWVPGTVLPGVNRQGIGPPDKHAKGTPFGGLNWAPGGDARSPWRSAAHRRRALSGLLLGGTAGVRRGS